MAKIKMCCIHYDGMSNKPIQSVEEALLQLRGKMQLLQEPVRIQHGRHEETGKIIWRKKIE